MSSVLDFSFPEDTSCRHTTRTGIGWIVAHARYLRAIDELQRKIMQDALAVTLGVGWVAGFSYVVADAADLIAHDAEIAVLTILLGVVYMIASVIGTLRYR